MKYMYKIETPGDVSIFLVNGEKKNSGSPLLDSQFELFTSSVQPNKWMQNMPFRPMHIPRVINLTIFFYRSRPVFIFIFLRIIRVLRRCSSLFPFSLSFTFFFFICYAGRLRSFRALICENRSFFPRRIRKKYNKSASTKKNPRVV